MRSFVKRQGRMTVGQSRALTVEWPRFGVECGPSVLDIAGVFGRDAPVTLEIGFGNGDNLIDMARQSPDTNFLGIEVHEPGVGHCLHRRVHARVPYRTHGGLGHLDRVPG